MFLNIIKVKVSFCSFFDSKLMEIKLVFFADISGTNLYFFVIKTFKSSIYSTFYILYINFYIFLYIL